MLIDGHFESDYSLAIVNRCLTLALIRAGRPVQWHQYDRLPGPDFFAAYPELAAHFVSSVEQSSEQVHSRYIYPPDTSGMTGSVRAVHCYGWEESVFPRRYVDAFNRDLDVITVMSSYVQNVLQDNDVRTPIEVIGIGADHILEHEPQAVGCFSKDTFHFLHISSCFPRKGADVLVNSFCREFQRRDDVRLIIKTFANPHNEIEQIVANAFARYPGHAPIDVIWDSFSPGQMRYLIENSNCLVAPSRGEGFGLPVAEAMLLGTPVIATLHGGHTDLCSPKWMWPVDFRIAPAETHLTEGASFWAEPNGDSLAARMRELYESTTEPITAKTAAAKSHISGAFTWERAALRHEQACLRALNDRNTVENTNRHRPIHIGFITTWNARCGIAEYTRYLAQNLAAEYRFSVFANEIPETVRPDEPNVSRCWIAAKPDWSPAELDALADRISQAGCDIVSFQYNFGLFSPPTVDALMRRLKEREIAVSATLHATANERLDELLGVLKSAEAVIVHRPDERDKLAAAGLDRVNLQRQGIYVPKDLERSGRSSISGTFVVSCFGFFLPHKGIYELLQAFESASAVNPALRLKLLNALYDSPESHAYASECVRFIRQHGLTDRVVICTEFLDHDTILRELADSDLIVLPYNCSTESSSAAIRLPLASLTPVLCSDLDIFKEFSAIVHSYPAEDVVALANRIIELSLEPRLLNRFQAVQRRYVEGLSWSNIARQFESILEFCLRSPKQVAFASVR